MQCRPHRPHTLWNFAAVLAEPHEQSHEERGITIGVRSKLRLEGRPVLVWTRPVFTHEITDVVT